MSLEYAYSLCSSLNKIWFGFNSVSIKNDVKHLTLQSLETL